MIEFNSRVDKIARDLQEQIAHGKLKPGERLPSERSLCAVFGVGRTTIREALKSLAVRGLVTRSARGAVVADVESLHLPGADLAGLAAQTSIRQLFEVRKLMEVRVAGWAASARERRRYRSHARGDRSRRRTKYQPAAIPIACSMTLWQKPRTIPRWCRSMNPGASLFFRLPFYWKLVRRRASKNDQSRTPRNGPALARANFQSHRRARCGRSRRRHVSALWTSWRKTCSTSCQAPTATAKITGSTLIPCWPISIRRRKKSSEGNR